MQFLFNGIRWLLFFYLHHNLQSLIARALDDDEFVAMASLDLSAAFDVVNVPLLIKRLDIIGLPGDVIMLIETYRTIDNT